MNRKKIMIIIASLIVFLGILLAFILIGKKEYTITFDSNGGSFINKQTVKKNEKVIKPIDPTKKNYEFDGWYLNGEKYYFDKEVTSNITLKAKWRKETEEKVKVTFDTDGGSIITSQEIKKGSKLNRPTNPVKEGYIFEKWLLDNNEFKFDVEIYNNITLKASYKKIDDDKRTVTFDSNGGSNVPTVTVKVGEKVSAPKNPTRNQYNFLGWYLNNKKYNFNTAVEDNIILVAKWQKVSTQSQNTNQIPNNTDTNNKEPQQPVVIKYNVSFNTNGGSSVATQIIIAGGKATQPNPPTKDGYRFINWTLNGSAYDFNSSVTNNITLVANWELMEVPDVYTVKLELINGDVNAPERKAIVYRNGSAIEVSQLLSGNGNVLGKYIGSLNAVRVNKAQYDATSTLKVKLTDGSIVDASKS